MAGAGYKLFATGDVLTAAQVNTYLMQQTVMVFADSAARTTALSGVLAEGMVSYLQDTNTLEVYNGSGWVGATGDITGLTAGTGISITSETGPVPTVAIDTAVTADLTTAQTLTNKTLTSPVLTTPSISNINAKGDILVGTADNTLGIITAGSNGETLVADSSTSTGLRYTANFAAGKNKIINGNFNINQRSFTSTTTSGTYGFDRWKAGFAGGTTTYSAQTFTAGNAPAAGYEGTNYARIVTTGQSAAGDLAYLAQFIEDVHTLAGNTFTISFWAKAATGTPKIGLELNQTVGTGGSGSSVTSVGNVTISTSWQRYSITGSLGTLVGVTPGTNNTSYLECILWVSAGSTWNGRAGGMQALQNNTFDIWGVQVEQGSVATAFQTATGTIQGELAACQRYYWRLDNSGGAYGWTNAVGYTYNTGGMVIGLPLPTQMRVAPTSIDYSGMAVTDFVTDTVIGTLDSIAINVGRCTSNHLNLIVSKSGGFTTGRTFTLNKNNNTANYIGASAEL